MMRQAFHDAQQGGYDADMDLWRALASSRTVLELGAGTGRVSLALSRAGHTVTAVELDRGLCRELRRRAAFEGLALEVVHDDALTADLGRYGLVIAATSFIQIVGGAPRRHQLLRAVRRRLAGGGLAAFDLQDSTRFAPGTSHEVMRGPLRFGAHTVDVRSAGDSDELVWARTLGIGKAWVRVGEIRQSFARITPERLVDEARAEGLGLVETHTVTDEVYLPGTVLVFRAM